MITLESEGDVLHISISYENLPRDKHISISIDCIYLVKKPKVSTKDKLARKQLLQTKQGHSKSGEPLDMATSVPSSRDILLMLL